jgi:hypothetical protein
MSFWVIFYKMSKFFISQLFLADFWSPKEFEILTMRKPTTTSVEYDPEFNMNRIH